MAIGKERSLIPLREMLRRLGFQGGQRNKKRVIRRAHHTHHQNPKAAAANFIHPLHHFNNSSPKQPLCVSLRMTSTRDGTRQELQDLCTEFVRRMVRLPLKIIEWISKAISHAAPRRDRQNLQSHQQPGLLIIPEEWHFITLLEQQYGSIHPFFYACRFLEALKIARDELKFVFLYLHAPDQSYTAPFCRGTLCSQLVVEFLDTNFVSWGAVVDRGEGSDMAAAVKAASFPFCAVVAPISDDSFAVLQQVEGPVSPEELVNILQKAIEEQGSAFRALRTEEEKKRRADRQLRAEQDAAYLESLKKDKENDRAKQRLAEEARAAAERQKQAKNERIQKNPDPSNKTKDASKETMTSRITKSTTKILIRFPNGQKIEQSFLCTDTIRSIFRYIDSLDIPGIGSYRLISNFPRKIFGYEQLEMTLKDAGLHPSATLFLELLE